MTRNNYREPNIPWPDYPRAPRRPPKSNLECKRQFVWPRDKKQKGAHTWDRLRDVLSGKGPDMWAGKQGDDGPNRNAWTHWGYGPNGLLFDNLGYHDQRDGGVLNGPNHFPGLGRRPLNQKYDFRTRRYKIPRPGDWSDVKWDQRGRDWLYYRTRWGTKFDHPVFFDPWNQAQGLSVFDYDPDTNHWDYYADQLP
ncbi:MAG: hypothetical protein Q9171_002274 [Xanthocarpia ochracea]